MNRAVISYADLISDLQFELYHVPAAMRSADGSQTTYFPVQALIAGHDQLQEDYSRRPSFLDRADGKKHRALNIEKVQQWKERVCNDRIPKLLRAVIIESSGRFDCGKDISAGLFDLRMHTEYLVNAMEPPSSLVSALWDNQVFHDGEKTLPIPDVLKLAESYQPPLRIPQRIDYLQARSALIDHLYDKGGRKDGALIGRLLAGSFDVCEGLYHLGDELKAATPPQTEAAKEKSSAAYAIRDMRDDIRNSLVAELVEYAFAGASGAVDCDKELGATYDRIVAHAREMHARTPDTLRNFIPLAELEAEKSTVLDNLKKAAHKIYVTGKLPTSPGKEI